MHSRLAVGAIVFLVVTTAGGGIAAAQGYKGGDTNTNFGLAAASAGAENIVENRWSHYTGDGGDGSAASNCQFLLGVQTFVLSVAAVDHLGLINDGDDFTGDFGTVRDIVLTDDDTTIYIDNATATCEQHVGAVSVFLQTSDGFGEAAPLGDMAGALNTVAGGRGGGGGTNVNIGLGWAFAGAEDVVTNEADIELDGDGAAAANCQILIAWQTAVVSAALVTQEGDIFDDDSTSIESGLVNGADITVSDQDQEIDIEAGTASCVQTVASIDLHLGTNNVEPSS